LKEVGGDMARQTKLRSGKYLYAVAEGVDGRIYSNFGIEGGLVYTISNGQVSAVVSDVPNQNIRPERRYLATHQEVLKRLMEEQTILPISFGIIADGSKAIKKILSSNQEAFLGQLRRVAGKVEMGLRVTWDVPNIFEYFVNTHPELRAARSRLFGAHREPTQEEKIELGRMFVHILSEDRDFYAEKVEGTLARHCFELKRNKCRNEREVLNLACLVGRDRQGEFEAAVFEAASLFDNNFSFDYNGPWAPHNFVEMGLQL
jgi:hypothetical protein